MASIDLKTGKPLGLPLASMTTIERGGPVIKKALVEIASKAFEAFVLRRAAWLAQSSEELANVGSPLERNDSENLMPVSVAMNQELMQITDERIPEFNFGEPTVVSFE